MKRCSSGMSPDKQWLSFVEGMSAGAFRAAEPRVFDPQHNFIPKYTDRRAALHDTCQNELQRSTRHPGPRGKCPGADDRRTQSPDDQPHLRPIHDKARDPTVGIEAIHKTPIWASIGRSAGWPSPGCSSGLRRPRLWAIPCCGRFPGRGRHLRVRPAGGSPATRRPWSAARRPSRGWSWPCCLGGRAGQLVTYGRLVDAGGPTSSPPNGSSSYARTSAEELPAHPLRRGACRWTTTFPRTTSAGTKRVPDERLPRAIVRVQEPAGPWRRGPGSLLRHRGQVPCRTGGTMITQIYAVTYEERAGRRSTSS